MDYRTSTELVVYYVLYYLRFAFFDAMRKVCVLVTFSTAFRLCQSARSDAWVKADMLARGVPVAPTHDLFVSTKFIDFYGAGGCSMDSRTWIK